MYLENYKGEFEFEYHKFENNLGSSSLTKQWERCVDLASNEEWIMILGDDDYLDSNVVASFYNNSAVQLVNYFVNDLAGTHGIFNLSYVFKLITNGTGIFFFLEKKNRTANSFISISYLLP